MMPPARFVKLTAAEIRTVFDYGKREFDDAEARGFKHAAAVIFGDDPLANKRLGFAGEAAVAKLLGVVWKWRPFTFRGAAGDVGHGIQVRTVRNEHARLKISPKDLNDQPFVLVVGQLPVEPKPVTLKVVGYQYAGYAKTLRFIDDPGNRGLAYFVPQNELRDVTELIEDLVPV